MGKNLLRKDIELIELDVEILIEEVMPTIIFNIDMSRREIDGHRLYTKRQIMKLIKDVLDRRSDG